MKEFPTFKIKDGAIIFGFQNGENGTVKIKVPQFTSTNTDDVIANVNSMSKTHHDHPYEARLKDLFGDSSRIVRRGELIVALDEDAATALLRSSAVTLCNNHRSFAI